MSKKHDFLDPEQQHTLSEQECELITFFRTLSPTRRQVVVQALFTVLFEGEIKKGKRKKDTDGDN